MTKRNWLLMLILVLVMALTVPSIVWATSVAAPQTEQGDEEQEEPETDADDEAAPPAEIQAALNVVLAGIDALQADDAVKARLRTIAQNRLTEAFELGLSPDQLNLLAADLLNLINASDLSRDLPHLNTACQFMLKAMRGGLTSAEAAALITAKLSAGMDLKTALQSARSELKGRQNTHAHGGNQGGQGENEGDNGGGQGNGHGNGHRK